MATPTAQLLAEIRESARHDLEAFELQSHLEGDEELTDEEIDIIAQVRHLQKALILAINVFLDE